MKKNKLCPAQRKFLVGNFSISMKRIWPRVFKAIKSYPNVDRVIWSMDALGEGMVGRLGCPEEPTGREIVGFYVSFRDSFYDLAMRRNIDIGDEELSNQLVVEVDAWLLVGLKESWLAESVVDSRKQNLKSRKLGVFIAENIPAIINQDYCYLCGNRVPTALTLSALLHRFCRKYDCLSPEYNFVSHDGEITQIDFSSLDDFSAISTNVVEDLVKLSIPILAEHQPKKLYLNKETQISKTNLAKIASVCR